MKHWQESREIFTRASELLAVEGSCAIGTVVAISGSAYRRPGAKMLTDPHGHAWGGVSGGCLEADVREVALRAMETGDAVLRRYDTGAEDDAARGLRPGCDGSVEIFVQPLAREDGVAAELLRVALDHLGGNDSFAMATVLEAGALPQGTAVVLAAAGTVGPLATPLDAREILGPLAAAALESGLSRQVDESGLRAFVDVFQPPPRVLVCGAGDDAIPLAAAAAAAGFRVVVADHRPAYLTGERFPDAELLDPETLLPGQARGAFGVVMNHNLDRDRALARKLVEGGAAYIGLLGPRNRREAILSEIDTANRDVVYGPVGLDIGAEGPEQVAVSVVAEMLAVRAGRQPRHLRDRERPIHEPADDALAPHRSSSP